MMQNKVFHTLFLVSLCGALFCDGVLVSVNVQDVYNAPVRDAYVWVGPNGVKSEKTGSGGTVDVDIDPDTYMIVARHSGYGRAEPEYVNIASETNIVLILPPRTDLRIASYNVEGNRNDGAWDESQIIPLAKAFWTVQPDVVLLQECPTEPSASTGTLLPDFQQKYLAGYSSSVSEFGYMIRNGIMSLYPIEETFSAGTDIMTRDLFGAVIEIDDTTQITFMSMHLKAGSGTSDGEQRNEEATFVGAYCSNLHAEGTVFIAGGDLNDDVQYPRLPAKVFTLLEQAGAGFERLAPTDEQGSLLTIPVINRRYDYLLPNENMGGFVSDSAVFRTETMNNRPAWLEYGDSAAASDHRMIYADFTIGPEPGWMTGTTIILLILSRRRTQTLNP